MVGTRRNPEQERCERDRYIILVHLFTLTRASVTIHVTDRRLSHDLSFSPERVEILLKSLIETGYIEYDALTGLMPTRKGRHYVEWSARRRKSVREAAMA